MATETFSRVTNVLTFRDGERVRTLPSLKEQMLRQAEMLAASITESELPSDCEFRAPESDPA